MVSSRLMKHEEEGVFSQVVNDDILLKILDKLPAVSFASAACVDKRWNQNCNSILSRPKLSSAMSLNPDLHAALDEVLGEAFSKPLRPTFLITYIGVNFNLEEAHRIITNRVGPGVPVITSTADGLIGREVESDRSREVIWGSTDDNSNRGIVLSVGYLPGLKVDVIPLLRPNTDFGMTGRYFSGPETQTTWTMVDHFLLEIMDYTHSISRSTAPSCIMIFGDQNEDMNQLLAILDRAMPRETAIVGDSSASFLCTRIDETQNKMSRDLFSFSAAALVFARDQNKHQDIGETEFHVAMSPGIIPFGTHLMAVSVLEKRCLSSWSSTIIVGLEGAIIDCYRILMELNSKLGKPDIYIGVTQARKYSILGKGPSFMDSLSYHEVKGGEMDLIVVDGTGIRPGDPFWLYHSDLENASVGIDQVCENLQTLLNDHAKNRREVFGGFIFSSRNRGAAFFNRPDVDSKPFAMNFPGVPVAGMFGKGQIARGALLGVKEEEEQLCPCSSVHAHSSVYLAMSYVPPKPQH